VALYAGGVDREDWNRRYAGSELIWSATPNRFLVAEIGGLGPGTALELACGEGRNAVWLAERGWTVTGVDFSDVALEKAHRLAEARGVKVEWIVADVVEHRLEPEAFDLVVLLYLQVPPGDRRAVVHSAAAALARGGTFLLVAHDRSNLEHGHGGPQDARVLYTTDDLAGDLVGTGLRLERAAVVERPVETPEGERVALDLLVRATRPG
jgi:SAM-dependent methyltransferase